jgi:hypothetical protein
MRPLYYPPATLLLNGVDGGYYLGGPWKGLLHTTETAGLPGYSGGWTAPHLTYIPATRRFFQHTRFTVASRALRNLAGGTQTNRDRVLQLEIVCYSDKRIATQYNRLWVGDLSPVHLADIREFMRWASTEFDIPWQYPQSDRRFTSGEFDNYAGWLGHKHAAENTHWDPGALDIQALMFSTKEEDVMQKGDGGPRVRVVQERLLALGFELPQYGADGDYGDETVEAVMSWQTSKELEADGIITALDMHKLFESKTKDSVARALARRAHKRLDQIKEVL